MKSNIFSKKTLVLFTFFNLFYLSNAQSSDSAQIVLNTKGSEIASKNDFSVVPTLPSSNKDSIKTPLHFAGTITATNNGLSLFPNFSLGRPAVLFDMTMGGNKLTFDPLIRFAYDGKPWSFILWWRYKAVKTNKFSLVFGAHPSFVFDTRKVTLNKVEQDVMTTRRNFAMEAVPTFTFSKYASFGVQYLRAFGIGNLATKNTNFFAVRTAFSNLKLGKDIYFRAIPQWYYLQLDDKHGHYVTSTFTLEKKKFPFTISSIVSQAIKTTIPTKDGKNLQWNVSLNYVFNKNFKQVD